MLESAASPEATPPSRRTAGERGLSPSDASPVPVQAILGVLRRRVRALLACAVLIPALSLIALRQTTPRYTASGTVIYDPNEYKPREMQSILRVDPMTPETMASQAEVLRNLRSVERVADQLGLFGQPEFNAARRRTHRPLGARAPRGLPAATRRSGERDGAQRGAAGSAAGARGPRRRRLARAGGVVHRQ